MTVYNCPDCPFNTREVDAAIVHEQSAGHHPADEVKDAPAPLFALGDKVKAVALPGGFPEAVPERPGLTVTSLRLIAPRETGPNALKPYWRVTAHGAGLSYVEGAERFFESE